MIESSGSTMDCRLIHGLTNGSKGRHVHDNRNWIGGRRLVFRASLPGTKGHGLGAIISRSAALQFSNYWV
jgi:hypothetical protein